MRKKFLLLFLLINLLSLNGFSGVITMIGNYKGQNLFIQNPYNHSNKSFCIVSVYINKHQVIHNPTTAALEVDLSKFETGEEVEIKIIYKKGCKPSVINPQAIKSNSLFGFTDIRISKSSILWSTHGESSGAKMQVEHYKGDTWRPIIDIKAKGEKSDNLYEFPSQHHHGLNKYRIVYTSVNNQKTYSHVYYYESSQVEATFQPKKVTDVLYFFADQPVYYIIYDKEGNILLEGRSHNIDCSSLPDGDYILYYDNKSTKIKVKKEKQ